MIEVVKPWVARSKVRGTALTSASVTAEVIVFCFIIVA